VKVKTSLNEWKMKLMNYELYDESVRGMEEEDEITMMMLYLKRTLKILELKYKI
jgi:hypothetical protein